MPLTSRRTPCPPVVAGDRARIDVPKVTAWSPWSAVGPALALLLLLPVTGPAVASDERISVELNRLEPVGADCRLTLVMTNGLASEIGKLTLETVLFDGYGRVERFLLFNARPLPAGKIRVQQFDVGGLSCDGIGRVLLNDVTQCEAGDLDAAGCLSRIDVSSRADASFLSTAEAGE